MKDGARVVMVGHAPSYLGGGKGVSFLADMGRGDTSDDVAGEKT